MYFNAFLDILISFKKLPRITYLQYNRHTRKCVRWTSSFLGNELRLELPKTKDSKMNGILSYILLNLLPTGLSRNKATEFLLCSLADVVVVVFVYLWVNRGKLLVSLTKLILFFILLSVGIEIQATNFSWSLLLSLLCLGLCSFSTLTLRKGVRYSPQCTCKIHARRLLP